MKLSTYINPCWTHALSRKFSRARTVSLCVHGRTVLPAAMPTLTWQPRPFSVSRAVPGAGERSRLPVPSLADRYSSLCWLKRDKVVAVLQEQPHLPTCQGHLHPPRPRRASTEEPAGCVRAMGSCQAPRPGPSTLLLALHLTPQGWSTLTRCLPQRWTSPRHPWRCWWLRLPRQEPRLWLKKGPVFPTPRRGPLARCHLLSQLSPQNILVRNTSVSSPSQDLIRSAASGPH